MLGIDERSSVTERLGSNVIASVGLVDGVAGRPAFWGRGVLLEEGLVASGDCRVEVTSISSNSVGRGGCDCCTVSLSPVCVGEILRRSTSCGSVGGGVASRFEGGCATVSPSLSFRFNTGVASRGVVSCVGSLVASRLGPELEAPGTGRRTGPFGLKALFLLFNMVLNQLTKDRRLTLSVDISTKTTLDVVITVVPCTGNIVPRDGQ